MMLWYLISLLMYADIFTGINSNIFSALLQNMTLMMRQTNCWTNSMCAVKRLTFQNSANLPLIEKLRWVPFFFHNWLNFLWYILRSVHNIALNLQKISHSSPGQVSYGISLANSKYDLCYTTQKVYAPNHWCFLCYTPGPFWMSSYQYRKSHCGDKTIFRPSYLHNGISYTGKTTS